MPRARILGTGSCLPPRVVTNDELSKRLTTSDEWIQQRSGVKERRYVAPGVGPSDLAFEATNRALDMAGLKASDLDFLILATQTPEHEFPGTACFLQKKLGNFGVGALDVRDQCTGFLYGLSIADAYVQLGKYKRVLVVGAEVHSTGLEFADRGRHITVLFGDGAGAVIVGPVDVGQASSPAPRDAGGDARATDRGILSTHLHADGRFAEELWVPAPGSIYPGRITHQALDEGLHYPVMNGKAVFKEAVTRMIEVSKEALGANGLTPADVTHFVPHQANLRINEMVARDLGIPPERCDDSIRKYGNCAAASVPIALDERVRSGAVKPGDIVLMSTFAAGFTWGAAVVRW